MNESGTLHLQLRLNANAPWSTINSVDYSTDLHFLRQTSHLEDLRSAWQQTLYLNYTFRIHDEPRGTLQ